MAKIVNELNPIITAFLLAVAMLAGWAASWWRGRSLREESREVSSNEFKDAILAMRGLLLAFTFSMSQTKHEQRRQIVVAAAHDRLPPSILLLLGVTAVLSNSLMGHQQGATGESHPGAILGFTLLACRVIGVTLDLNQSQRGGISVTQAPLEQLLKSMD